MLLNQLVEINQEAFISRAVSFNLMNTDKNLKLCKGFIFNHDTNPTRAKNTSVGILDAIRRSFHSSSEPNVHLIVQEYGKGKSHFALTVANFFKLSHESEEVQGILNQLKCATSENSTTFQTLKAYKERGKHLVICLSAADVTDMRKHFFQELNKELKSHDVTDAIAQKICREPLQFLENLDNDKRQQADKYLIKNFSMTVVDIERRMTENDFQAIDTVKKLCFELTGINPDFSSSIQIGEIIDDLVNKLCKGENAPFQGILILFDELYEYLRNWVTDTTGTGGLFLQNITDACDKHQGKIAFVSLTQKTPSGITVSAKNSEDYKRIVSRIDPNTYNPKASLELVLDGLLNQLESNGWESFLTKWRNDLNRKSLDVFSKKQVQTYYNDISWKHEDFYRHLAIGCFPLHPLTSYLLCNLSFAQGRSVIDFIQQEVKEFISNQAVEKNGLLNLIYPIALVDAFESNFANPEANTEYITVFSDYKSSLNIVQKSSDVNPDEIAVLKALLLFWTSGAKLQKTEEENHEELLQSLTGLSKISIAKSLEKLTKVREVIYHNLAEKTYRFHQAGKGIDELRHRIREEAKHKQFFIDDVEKHFNDNIGVYTSGKGMTIPQQFVDVKRLRTEDWFFQNKVFSIKNLRSLLQKNQPFKTSDQSGIVAYVIAETSEEILLLEKDIMKLIEKHPYRDQFAVAIAERPIEELAQLMLEKQAADKFKPQEFGAALSQLKGQYAKQIENETKSIFKSVEFYSHIIEDIPQGDKTNISIIISEILEQSYSLIPPIEGSDKLYLKSAKGSSGNAFIAKRILEDDLRPESLEAAYKGIVEVYVKSWGLLRFSLKTKKYEVVIPTQKDVRKAWDKISALTDLGEESDKITQLSNVWEVLSSPPYGYNAYTFTILLTGWMAYHRSEVFIEGSFGIPQKKSEQIRVKIEPVKSWVSTNILDKPKEFISEWILKSRPRIIRRKPSLVPELCETYDYDLARQKSADISDFVANSGTPDKYQNLVDHQQSLATACSRIEQSFEPAVKIETLIESTSISSWADVSEFVDLYSDLQSPLINFAENGLTVICTTEQQRRYTQALQSALEKIEAAIEIESDRLTKLTTEEDCGSHKANLTQAINRLNQFEDLPNRFVVSLQKSLNDTEKVRDQIINQKKTDGCVVQIQNVYATLSEMATQQEFISILDQIATLADPIPSVKETETYRNTIDNIGARQDLLVQQFATWESQYDLAMTRDQASTLKDHIAPQSLRYTDQISQNRLQDLLRRLNNIILERQSQASEKEKLEFNDVKSTNNPFESMKYYLQLTDIKLPVTSSDDAVQQNLENIKTEGFAALTEKITQIVERSKRKLEEESKVSILLKSLLPKMQELADTSDEFAAFRSSLNEATEELDKQYELLQKRIQDKQVMQAISRYSLAKANTLCLCEEAIAEILTERQKLNFPDAHTEEIERQVQAFQDKVNNHQQSLHSLQQDLLSAIDSSQLTSIRAKYHKLEHIFRNSSQFIDYQQFESQIDLLDDDIKVIVQLQDLGSSDRANSLETCDRVIYQIDHGKTTLHEPERFSVKLQDLKNTLLQRKQSYLSKLTEFRDGLSNAATTKEAKEVRQQIGKDLSLYQNSEEFLNYESISKESEDLIGLLQIFESQEIETPENCVAEIAKLHQWQDTNPDIASTLRSRVESKLEKLENKRQELQIVGRRLAESWFNRTQQKIVTVREIAEQSEKFSSSSNLIKHITKEISKHADLLDQSQKEDLEQYLEEANAFCDEIKRLDREEKIIAQFQELPIAQRASLYERLANYLNNAEEEES
jgi:hypothetical protein